MSTIAPASDDAVTCIDAKSACISHIRLSSARTKKTGPFIVSLHLHLYSDKDELSEHHKAQNSEMHVNKISGCTDYRTDAGCELRINVRNILTIFADIVIRVR